MLGQTVLYNETFTRSLNNISNVMFMSRLNSTTGEVKWSKAFNVKATSNSSFINYQLLISDAQIIWFIYYQDMVRFIPRIDQEGNILQIIAFRSKGLNLIDMMSYLYILSENEFIIFQSVQNLINGISISNITGTDVSVVRMTTEPKVEYNLMIDYNNFVDGVIRFYVVNKF